MLKFTPPKEDAATYRYASYVVGTGLKVHGSIGAAKNSWRNRGWDRRTTRHGFILENVNGEWFTLYEIKPGLTEEELPWMKEYYKDDWGMSPYTEYHQKNTYYQKKLESGLARIVKKATPMSVDEYVDWRLAVEREIRGI